MSRDDQPQEHDVDESICVEVGDKSNMMGRSVEGGTDQDHQAGGLGKAVDGGWGWVVVLGSSICHFFLLGLARTLGIVFILLREKFNASAKETGLVTAIFVCLRSAGGPVASKLSDRFGCRRVAIVGSLLLFVGVTISAFAFNIIIIYISFGVVAGIGAMLVFSPSYIVVSYWFDKKKGKAMSLSTIGTGLGNIVLAHLVTFLVLQYHFSGTMLIVGALMLNCAVGACLYRKPPPAKPCVTPPGGTKIFEKISPGDEPDIADSDVIHLEGAPGRSHKGQDLCASSMRSPTPLLRVSLAPGVNSEASDRMSQPVSDPGSKEVSGCGSTVNDKVVDDATANVSTNMNIIVNCDDATEVRDRMCLGGDASSIGIKGQFCLVGEANSRRVKVVYMEEAEVELKELEPNNNSFKSCTSLGVSEAVAREQNSEENIKQPIADDVTKWDELDATSEAVSHSCPSAPNCVRSSLWTNVPFFLYCLMMAGLQGCIQSVLIFLPSYANELGSSSAQEAWLLTMFGVADLVGRFAFGFIFDIGCVRPQRVQVYTGVSALFALSAVALALTTSYEALGAVTCLTALFEGGAHSQRATVVPALVETHQMSMGVGLCFFFSGLGNFYGPLVGGVLRDVTLTYKSCFIFGGSLFLFICLINAIYRIVRHQHDARSRRKATP